MDPDNRNDEKKPGLPEALFPEIGNGLLWENGVPEKTLRSIDPTVSLDASMLYDDTRRLILGRWSH